MPSDQEHLQSAGIQDTEATPNQSPATDTAAPTPETAQQPQTPETEMFELMGNKYPVNTEFQFPHGGKNLKVPYNSLVNTYRQAAHMQDKWTELRKLQEDSKTKLTEFDKYKGFYDKYGQLQDWSEKNPQQWQTIWDLYQNKDKHLLSHQLQNQPGQPGQQHGFNPEPLVHEITQLKGQLSKYDQMLQKMEANEREAAESKDVESVKNEVQTFSKEFPEIDVTERDPDGVPLWAKIVQWGNSNGYQSWEPAAHMFLKQRIAEAYQGRARSEATKSLKADRMQGVIKRSATPITGQGQKPFDLKKASYAQIAEMAKNGQFATQA